MAISSHPLTQEHLDAINRCLQRCGPALELAQACKECGLPVDDMIEGLQEQQRVATALKRTFFPTKP